MENSLQSSDGIIFTVIRCISKPENMIRLASLKIGRALVASVLVAVARGCKQTTFELARKLNRGTKPVDSLEAGK